MIAQAVADARLSNDESWPGGIDLDFLSELRHVHSNMVLHFGMPIAPNLRQDLAMCQDPAGIVAPATRAICIQSALAGRRCLLGSLPDEPGRFSRVRIQAF